MTAAAEGADLPLERVLTIWQPYAFAMAEGFKPIECRPKPTGFKGTLLLHAGQKYDDSFSIVRYSPKAAARLDELGGSANFWDARTRIPSTVVKPPHPTLAHSAVIATAQVVGCHENTGRCCRPWGKLGRWHWVLEDVQALTEAVACPGRQSLWKPSPELLQKVRSAR
ncbi:hypothetical protein [Streptomyces ipomoeae]|uniref:hypothetical protein n=1 Tax=Streptomyces ipomoeae TaxID=103232 RepID=UPI001146F0B7|nr:hypothetical protein [Streptomyces ipomoeae]TQE33136.1 hypothetical protein Sipo7851_21820 [Streptomyces ipomoeae]